MALPENFALNLVAAVVILIIGILVGRFLSNITKKVLQELELDRVLKEKVGIKLPLTQLISSIIKYLVYVASIITALNQLGLQSIILNVILWIIIAVLIVFMILSLKDFIPNLVAGLFLFQKRNINAGEMIRVNDIEGEVLNITLLETKIRTRNHEIVYIPNSILIKNVVIKKKKVK